MLNEYERELSMSVLNLHLAIKFGHGGQQWRQLLTDSETEIQIEMEIKTDLLLLLLWL